LNRIDHDTPATVFMVDRGFFVGRPFSNIINTFWRPYRGKNRLLEPIEFKVGRDSKVEGQLRPDVFITRSAAQHCRHSQAISQSHATCRASFHHRINTEKELGMTSKSLSHVTYGMRALERFNNASRKAAGANTELERAKKRFIEWLKEQPVGVAPAIDHHIINTEQRELNDEEKRTLYATK
jgi:hypothetical protein